MEEKWGGYPERSGWVSQDTTDYDYGYRCCSAWIIDFTLCFLPRYLLFAHWPTSTVLC